jgi:dTDP-4-dehydrorhamnose 3,5-epimerase
MPMPVKVRETELSGVLELETPIARDERGYFTELYNQVSFATAGLIIDFRQDNLSLSGRGTLRGMHYQVEPHGMAKLVRVVRGAIFDVAIDLRRGSPTFGGWVGRELSADNGRALWVPIGFAHGFLALEEESLVLYKCTNVHTPEAERALSYRDPAVGVRWPMEPTRISAKDLAAPPLDQAEHNFVYGGPGV